MSTRLEIRTLGGLAIKQGDTPVAGLVSRKAEALLVYLACTGRSQPRPVLANLLWDDGSERRVMNNLRVLLSSLRKEVGPHLTITRDTAAFCRDSNHWFDVAMLEEGLAAIQLQAGHPDPEQMAGAARTLDVYQGDFLHGFYLRGCRGFEEWVTLERERLRLRTLEALQHLVTAALSLEQHETALDYVGRLLQLDPLHEVAHRQKMFLLAVNGQRHAALTQFDHFRRLMADELGVTPTAETTTLYRQIQAGQVEANAWHDPAGTAPANCLPGPLPACPYRGLSPFGEEDSRFFFGRERFTRRLVEVVRRQPVAAVVGPSGSGKSSVVMAGLLPHLRREPAPPAAAQTSSGAHWPASPAAKGWIVANFRPTGYPCHALAAALMPLLEANLSETDLLNQTNKLAKAFCRGDLQPSEVINRILHKHPGRGRLLLVVDQFEEFYTHCPAEDTCQDFLTILLEPLQTKPGHGSSQAAVTTAPDPVHLIITLRADFLARALAFPYLADALQDSTVILGSMTRQELSRAVSQPAAVRGVTFEPGLVERILDDVGQQPGQLPLLEFALTTLWDHQSESHGQLTHAAYEKIGRVDGALAQYADRVYTDLSPAEQAHVRRALVQLIRPGQQAEDARRQATRAELGEANWTLVQKLSHDRLVVTGRNPAGQESVELIHEALLSAWSRLATWLEEDRSFRLWQEQLRVLYRQWENSDRDEGALLRGALLAEAETWGRTREIDLGSGELAFLQASKALQEREQLAVQARYQHELTLAQRLATTQARASRRLRWLAIGLGLMFTVALCGVIIAIYQGQQAQDQAQLALGRQLAAQAQAMLLDQPDLALLLSVEANRLAEITGDENALPIGLTVNPYLARFLPGHSAAVNHLAVSPDGRLLASAGSDNTIMLWDLVTGQPICAPLTGHTGQVTQVAFSPDGTILASAGLDTTIILWAVDSQQPRGLPLIAHQAEIVTVAFDPGGQRLLSASRDNTVIVWDVPAGRPVSRFLTGHADGTKQVAFSPDGRTLASVGGDSAIFLWSATGQHLGPPLEGHAQAVKQVAFSPDGELLASAGADQRIILWVVETGQALGRPLLGHGAAVNTVAFNPTGTVLASGSADHTIILWEVASGQPLGPPLIAQHADVLGLVFSPDGRFLVASSTNPLLVLWDLAAMHQLGGHNQAINQVAFSPDGSRLVTVSEKGILTGWEASTGRPIPGLARTGVGRLAFSPNGETLATANQDGTVTLQNIETGQQRQLAGLDGQLQTMAFSPNGQFLAAAGGDDYKIVMWPVAGGNPVTPTRTGPGGPINSLAFSPDGQILAAAGADQTVTLWDAAAGQSLGPPLTGHSGQIWAVAFSPDGRLLASAGDDDTIRLWEVASGLGYGRPLSGHTDHIQDIAFSPDGQLLASAGRDRLIIVWEVAGLKPYSFPLTGHQDRVQSVAFSPRGQLLASGAHDGITILWRLEARPWPLRACAMANRTLTRAEWTKFIGTTSPYQPACPNPAAD